MIGREPSAARSQKIQVGAYLTRMLVGMAVTVILGRALAPDAFGFYTLVGTVYFLSHLFLDLGAGPLAVAEIARDRSRERPLLEGLLAFRRLIGILLALGVSLYAVVSLEGDRMGILMGAGGSLILLAPLVLMVAFQVRQRLGAPAVLGLASQIAVLLGVLLFSTLGLAHSAYAWLLVGREVLHAACLRIIGVRLLEFTPKEGFRGRDLSPFLRRVVVRGSASLLHVVYFQVDVFFVRALAGISSLGAYSSAFRLVNPLFHIPGVAMAPLLPVLAHTAENDRQTLAALIRGSGALVTGFGAVGGLAAVLLAPELIETIYGGGYSGGELDATEALRWMGIALAAVFATGAFTTALVADRGERVLLVLGIVGLVVNVSGNLALIPIMGFTGAAFTTAVTEVVVLLCSLLFLWRGRRLAVVGLDHLQALLPAVLLLPILLLLPGGSTTRVILGAVAGAAALLFLWKLPVSRRFFELLHRAEVRMQE